MIGLNRELKKFCDMKVTVIPIVIGVFRTIHKRFVRKLAELEIGGRAKTIQTAALLRSARILRSGLEIWGNLLSLEL